MNASMLNTENNQSRLKVSISARLAAALAYIIPAIGGALSSLWLMRVFEALKMAENAGILAVMGGIKEATIPVVISLYLAAFVGIGVIIFLIIRMLIQTTTAAPPFWFFVLGGIFGMLPAALFWFAKYLTIEAISPGSSISAGGLGSVGAGIAQMLMLSVIATPFVVILLTILSVVPLSSRPNAGWFSLAAALMIEILLIAVAVAVPFLINEPKRKNESVKLPEVKSGVADYDIERESSVILTLTADHKLSERRHDGGGITENVITREELPELVKKAMRDKSPDKRIVYLKVDTNASTETVLQILDRLRKADVDKVGLVAIGKKDNDDPYQINARRFEVKLPLPMTNTNEPVRPNPLTLVAMLENDGRLMLNREDMGTISDTSSLEEKLTEVFKQRENYGVFRVGTNEVEKTVYVKVSKSVKYADFIKLVEAVTIAGAQPVGVQLNDLNF